ncbi:tetratricopeptide repeat protein [Aquirufa rosea]|uniref:Tetratricopeptide repeat protein n=1 Tax=Aquirufa rosea TaxID=2509241 RepID=A0A4Q1C2F1_9BACT|nr:tetratricopeptide repeat protein [Aquirufa rosea]RXK52420.1 tetratricopeptide repeat protein [Aquirufa rosea]
MRKQNLSLRWLPAILFFLLSWSSVAQQTLNFGDQTLHFRQAKEYFDSKNYVAAKEEFSAYLNSLEPLSNEQAGQRVLAEYYITMCSLYMSQPEAEIVADRFVANYPEHPQAVKLMRGIGSFFYDNGDYKKAIKYLSKSSDTNLEAKFKLAVSYYQLKELREALPLFNEIKVDPDEEFAFAAAYYAGVINFGEKRYGEASNDFRKAEGSSRFRKDIPNWIAMCYYHEGKFNELLNYAEPILKQKKPGYNLDELSLLVAEVQFKLSYFEKAVISYGLYKKLNPTKITSEIQYRFGYSLYKTNKFNEASDELKSLAGKKDTLAQFAAFTLGLAQLKSGNLEATLQAFGQAKDLGFNSQIQEEAFFNHAKVMLDLGKASETIYSIQEFNKKFPKSKFTEESTELVAEAFIHSNNIQAALDYLKSLSNRNSKLNAALQTLTYNLGVKAYNENKFDQAIEMFQTSTENPESSDLKYQALFGKGEALSQQKKYEQAIQVYSPLLIGTPPVSNPNDFIQKVRMGLAYAYFNIKDFAKANVLFKAYVDRLKLSPNAKNNPSVLIRLADTYLVSKKYEDALTYYNQAFDLAKSEKDYALYQKGVTLTYLNRDTEAKASFKQLRNSFPSSKYVDDAAFQENVISFNTNKYKEAIAGFSDLIENSPKSPYFTQALLKRAQSYANTNQHELSIADYKRIIQEFPSDKTAKDALVGLQEELNEVGRPEDFGQLLGNFQKSSPDEAENVDLEYRAAKGIYLGEKYDKAIAPLKAFIEKYPSNENVVEATYLIADAAYRTQNKADALVFYKKMIEQNVHPQINKAIQRSAEMELENKNFSAAANWFHVYKLKYNTTKDQMLANQGLLSTFLEAKMLDSAAYITDEIIQSKDISEEEKAKLAEKMANTFEANGDVINQRNWLGIITNLDKNDIGALAQLKLATLLSKESKYKESSDMILDKFRNVYSEASDAILGKAYILLADNFIALKNIPQARATLKSIVDNSSDTEVIQTAKTKLESLPLK